MQREVKYIYGPRQPTRRQQLQLFPDMGFRREGREAKGEAHHDQDRERQAVKEAAEMGHGGHLAAMGGGGKGKARRAFDWVRILPRPTRGGVKGATIVAPATGTKEFGGGSGAVKCALG